MACNKKGKKENLQALNNVFVNIAIIGAPRCGKTSLIETFFDRHRNGNSYFDHGVVVFPCRFGTEPQSKRVALFEIPSTPLFPFQHRVINYYAADIILFMYAIDDPSSLTILREHWIPEVRPFIQARQLPVMYMGSKNDLRNDPQVIESLAAENLSPVTVEQGSELENIFPVASLVEGSADYYDDVYVVLRTAYDLYEV